MQCRRRRRCGFDPWFGKIPWRRALSPTHSSIFAWRIPWAEEPGGLWSIELQSWTWPEWLSAHACTQAFSGYFSDCSVFLFEVLSRSQPSGNAGSFFKFLWPFISFKSNSLFYQAYGRYSRRTVRIPFKGRWWKHWEYSISVLEFRNLILEKCFETHIVQVFINQLLEFPL